MRVSRQRPLVQPFYLYRHEDVSGVSGTGIVAIGVVLPSGHAVMEWQSRWPTVTIFQTIEHVERIHGHGGRTHIGWGIPPRTNQNANGLRLLNWCKQILQRAEGEWRVKALESSKEVSRKAVPAVSEKKGRSHHHHHHPRQSASLRH